MKKIVLKIPSSDSVSKVSLLDKKAEVQEKIAEISANYSQYFLITDQNVYQAQTDFFAKFPTEKVLVFPPGEAQKTSETVLKLTEKLAKLGADRQSLIIAVGGGVATDLGAFIASIYQRGVDCVLVPTSLLAMVDASVGGKTAIDAPWGKNQLGTFYWVREVLLCPEFLATLPIDEIRNGLSEMLKHGIIASQKHFSAVSELIFNFNDKISRDFPADLIWDSVQIKAEVVGKDGREKSGERIKLNLGHTFAHAIEQDSQLKVPHGHAVAIGLKLAANFSRAKGLTDDETVEKISATVDQLFPRKNTYKIEKLWKLMLNDKKREARKINLILPLKIGKVAVKKYDWEEFGGS